MSRRWTVFLLLVLALLGASHDDLVAELADPEAADAAVDDLVAIGSAAVPGLLEAARTSADDEVRNLALTCLSRIGGDQALAALETLVRDESLPAQFRGWAAAARAEGSRTSDELLRVIDELSLYEEANGAIAAKLDELDMSGDGARLIRSYFSDDVALRSGAIEVMALDIEGVVDAMLTAPDEQGRLRAATVLMKLAQTGHDIVSPLNAALVWRVSAERPPWGRGLLAVRVLQLETEEGAFLDRELMRWRIAAAWVGWPEAALQLDAHFKARDLSDLLYDWGQLHGADDVRSLLEEQGVAAYYRDELGRLGWRGVLAEPGIWLHVDVPSIPGVAALSGKLLIVHDGSGGSRRTRVDFEGLEGGAVESLWSNGRVVIGAGSDGLLAVDKGRDWVLSQEKASFRDLWASGPSDAFAVGPLGVVFRAEGGGWSRMQTPALDSFEAVWGSGPTNVYAVTAGGVVATFNGRKWSYAWPGDLEGGVTSKDTETSRTITIHTPTTKNRLRDVWGSGPDDVFAVGDRGLVVHFDGREWVEERLGKDNLRGVTGSGPKDVYAVGASTWHFDGSAWSELPGPGISVRDLAVPVGSGELIALSDGEVAHFDGEAWTVDGGGTSETLVALSGRFAAGTAGTIVALAHGTAHETGSDADLAAVVDWGDRAMAVGDDGTVLVYEEGRWAVVESGTTADLEGVWGTGPDDVHAVGARGIRHFDGREWVTTWEGGVALHGVWGRSAVEAWAVGDNGTLLAFDGTNWTEEDCPVSSRLEAVGGYGSEVVAVGDRGLVLTRTDEGWVDRSILDRLVSLDSLWGDGRQLFATTHRGAVLRYDGSRWRMETTGQSGFVRAVQADTAVGANGLVMHRSRTSP